MCYVVINKSLLLHLSFSVVEVVIGETMLNIATSLKEVASE